MTKPDIWWPLKSVYVTGAWANSPWFYARFGQKGHNGIDLRAKVGTPVYAADDGKIEFEGWGNQDSWMGSIAGICIRIKHSWGRTGYAHLSRTIVDRGEKVKRGQLIGYTGNTGVGTAAHFHFETMPNSPVFGNGFAGRVNPAAIATLHARGWIRRLISRKPGRKTVKQIALEVLRGKWGAGEARKRRLKKAGYSYTAVQAEVNRRLRR